MSGMRLSSIFFAKTDVRKSVTTSADETGYSVIVV